jgi:uncharacterized Rmd1/YagE family protein
MQKIGELFLLRTNISSVGSVLDSPEVFWVRIPHFLGPTLTLVLELDTDAT